MFPTNENFDKNLPLSAKLGKRLIFITRFTIGCNGKTEKLTSLKTFPSIRPGNFPSLLLLSSSKIARLCSRPSSSARFPRITDLSLDGGKTNFQQLGFQQLLPFRPGSNLTSAGIRSARKGVARMAKPVYSQLSINLYFPFVRRTTRAGKPRIRSTTQTLACLPFSPLPEEIADP